MCSISFLREHINTRSEYQLIALNKCAYCDINGSSCHHLEKIDGLCIKHYIAKLCWLFYNEYLSVIRTIDGYTLCGSYTDRDNPDAIIYCYILTDHIGQKTSEELATLSYYEKEVWIPDQAVSFSYNLLSNNPDCVFSNSYDKLLEAFNQIDISESGILENIINKAADMGLVWQ
jgi:hypothetical protein